MNRNQANRPDVVIVGSGPAGLFAASRIGKPLNVILIEKNAAPGRKLLLSGSGRCNVTHAGDAEDFLNHYGDNGRFMRSALNAFSNVDLMRFLSTRGLKTATDKNGKVFPLSGDSRGVLDILVQELRRANVRLHCNERVIDAVKTENGFRVVTTNEEYSCAALLIATGGQSWPSTGSSGDGFRLAKQLGHRLIPPKPALTPMYIKNYPFTSISGLSLEKRRIQLWRNNRKLREHQGDIGFTHKGLSGPGILDFSRFIEKNDLLKINLAGIPEEEFRQSLITGRQHEGGLALKRFLKRADLPDSLVKLCLEGLKMTGAENLAQLTRQQQGVILEAFTAYPLEVAAPGGFKEAMATAGGVDLKEISGKTMESRIVPRLYFAGEVLDIDGDTGGYNIQAAFSTAFLAAEGINRL